MATGHRALRVWPTRRDLRLGSGLVLFVYIALHLVNHALGLASLALAERCLKLAMALWHSAPGTVVLYGAAAIHLALAFLALYQRRTLRMPPVEVVRIALGFGMPLLLIGHVTATRIALELYGQMPQYARTVWSLWASDSEGRQMALLAPGWLHGCLGLHLAFHRRTWFARWRLPLFAIALLLPVLSAVGFVAMARELERVATDPQGAVAALGVADMAQRIALAKLRDNLLTIYFAAIGAVFAAREVRGWMERSRGVLVSIAYPGRTVKVPRGWSVLEASRSNHIPHQSMCGGRARCSTCRVRVVAGEADCPAPEADELRTLERIGAQPDVRLACQLRPVGPVSVVPMLAPAVARSNEVHHPVERDVVILLIEWRAWSTATLDLLPQDRLYLLSLFSEAVCAVVAHGNGLVNAQGGDRIVAVFGRETGLATAARQAVAAADRVAHRVGQLNARVSREFGREIELRIFGHAGHAVVGEVGHGEAHAVVAIGEAMEGASQLRSAPEAEGRSVRLSEALRHLAGDMHGAEATPRTA